MAYNTIIVQFDLDAAVTPRLSFAMALAERFEADLIGFGAAEPHIFTATGEGGMVAAELTRQQVDSIQEKLKALREEFLGVAGDGGRVSWRGEVGNPTQRLSLHARSADLVITGVPSDEVAGDTRRTVEPGELILSAGRPVLLASESLAPLDGQKVVVAWKDTREARRAVVDAMPFLEGAREVTVATIAESEQKAARESAADVVRFLMRHGVKARSDVVDVGGTSYETAIAEIARERGADLIVAGGYGHSRLREWVFGGMTRSLLADGSLHRLVSN